MILFPRGDFGGSGYEIYIKIPKQGSDGNVLIEFEKKEVQEKAEIPEIKLFKLLENQSKKQNFTPLSYVMDAVTGLLYALEKGGSET